MKVSGSKTVGGNMLISHAGRKWSKFLLLAGAFLAVLFGQYHSAQAQGFATTGNMGTARQFHAAAMLNYSGVLITGGYNGGAPLDSAEIYNPLSGNFSAITAPMNAARRQHTATRMTNDRVLIIGGYSGLSSAEIYDPSTRSFTLTGSMKTGRWLHTATMLNNGKILVTGGRSGTSAGSTLNKAEIYDPATGSFTDVGDMHENRAYHTATHLDDDRVLITGGLNSSGSAVGSAEIFDPNTLQFTTTTGAMATARAFHAAVLLNDGKVLVTGGAAGSVSASINSAEIFTPVSAPGTGSFTSVGAMQTPHSSHTATVLSSGNVLIAGSLEHDTNSANNAAELYFPGAGGGFFSAGTMNSAHSNYSAILLSNGTVLLAGGQTPTATNAAEIFNPASILVAPAGYIFPDTVVNSTSDSRLFTISNSGISDLTLTSISVTGTDGAMFAKSSTCGTLPATIPSSGSCSVSVTFSPTSTGNKSASLDITSDDSEIPVWQVPLSGNGVLPAVTITLAGSGGGIVQSSPAGITCGPTCLYSFANGTQVTLTPYPDLNSLFSWSGGCAGTGDCILSNLSANVSATATFNYIKPAKIHGSAFTFDTLTAAYNDSNTVNGSIIDARSFAFSESPNFAGGKLVTFNGGYDLNYSINSGAYSTVTGGTFTVTTGQITLSNIIIQ